MATDLNQTDLGAEAWELLHELRLRGFVPAKATASPEDEPEPE